MALNGPVRQLDSALQDATGEALQRLGRGVGMDSRECAGMASIQGLQEVEGFATTNFPDNDPVRPVAQTGLQQITDGDCGNAVLFAAGLEADKIRLVDLYFSRIFDKNDAVLVGDERRQDVQHRSLAGPGSAADEEVVAGLDLPLQKRRDFRYQGASLNQVFNGEMLGVELANGKGNAVDAARPDDGSYAATVGQPRIKNGFSLGNIIPQAAGDVAHRRVEGSFGKADIWNGVQLTGALDKDARAAIDHDLGNGIVQDQVLNGPQKRQD